MRIKSLHFAWDNPREDLIPWFEAFAKTYHRKHKTQRMVYVLTNFDSTMEENLYRIYKLREIGWDPFVMVYDKPNAPLEVRWLQRWCNNKWVFGACERFEDYRASIRKGGAP